MNALLSRRDTLCLLAALGVPIGAMAAAEAGASGLTARVTLENVVSDRRAGEVAWFEAGWHAAENVGPAGASLCMVEIKDKDWKPSTV